MSHIQGSPHPIGTTEHLDYIRVDVDTTGALSRVAVVTHHRFNGLDLPQNVIVYRLNPNPSERDLTAVFRELRRISMAHEERLEHLERENLAPRQELVTLRES